MLTNDNITISELGITPTIDVIDKTSLFWHFAPLIDDDVFFYAPTVDSINFDVDCPWYVVAFDDITQHALSIPSKSQVPQVDAA